jgi:hypothetical protein
MVQLQSLSIKFRDWFFKKPFKNLFPELTNIELTPKIISVSELHGQRLYNVLEVLVSNLGQDILPAKVRFIVIFFSLSRAITPQPHSFFTQFVSH